MTDEKNVNPEDQGEIELVFDVDEEKSRERSAAAHAPQPQEGPDGASDGAGEGVDQLREELQRMHDLTLRARADLDNLRKRTEREKSEYTRYALTEAVRELLPVADNFERALASPGSESEEFRKGIELIYRQLMDILQKFGVKTIEEVPAPFDPRVHEAIARVDDVSVPSNTVIDVLQKGYFLNERLVRPAMVRVAMGGPERASENE